MHHAPQNLWDLSGDTFQDINDFIVYLRNWPNPEALGTIYAVEGLLCLHFVF